MKRVIERVSGYKITLSKIKGARKRLDSTNLMETDPEIIEKFGSVSKHTMDKYHKNNTFRQNVNYTLYYETLNIEDNVIFYESFHGKNMSCNPYAIFKQLINDPAYKEYRHVWALNEREHCPAEFRDLPNVEFVEVHSDEYLRSIASSKYLINNTSFPPYFIKKEGQVYLNTWHGTPLKTLGKDMMGTIGQHKNLMRNFLQTDYILAPNQFTADKLVDSHDLRGIYQGKIALTGYPRIDLTLADNHSVREKLGVDDSSKIILYAPTWRGEVGNVSGEIDKLIKDMEYLQQKVGSEYTIVLKVHSLMQTFMMERKTKLVVVPDHIEGNELLSVVDILITDYSSIFFDYLVRKKPIIFYAYDQDSYMKNRGFYLQLEDMPGPICKEIDDVLNEIQLADSYVKTFATKIKSCTEQFIKLDDGHSTERIINTLFNEDDSYTYSVSDQKTNILFYCGGFLNNGVTTSAINLMNNIDYDKYNVIVADKGTFNEEDMFNFSKLNPNVKKLYRVGAMNVLPIEVDKQEYLFKRGAEQFYEKGSKNYLDTEIVAMYKRENKRMLGNAKIDIAIDFSGYVKFWTLLLAESDARKKLIFQHNEMMEEYRKVVGGVLKHRANLNVIFPLYNYYDYIISVAKHTRDKNQRELEHLVLNSKEKMVYVHNSINYQYVLDSVAAKETKNIDGKMYYVNEKTAAEEVDESLLKTQVVPNPAVTNFVTMGRMSPEKDQKKLIQAFAQVYKIHSNISLYIIGSGDLQEELEEMIASYGLTESIHLVGQLANPFPLIGDCDCFVLPSNHEGQPMVLLECLILNKPIIATDIPGNRSVLEGGYGHIVENSIGGLVDGMMDFIENEPSFSPFDYKTYNQEAVEMFYRFASN